MMFKGTRNGPRQTFVFRSRFWLSLVSVILHVALFGCGRSERPEIGSRLDSPIALASHPSKPVYYVLNAALSGEYRTGSLQAYAVPEAETLAKEPLVTLESPRLGTSLALPKTGEFLVAGFSGSQGEIRVFPLNDFGVPTGLRRVGDSVLLPSGRIGTIQVHPVNGQSGVWTVVVGISERSSSARVLIYKYALEGGFSLLGRIPDDFYQPSRENALGAYSLSWGVPAVLQNDGLVVAFPQGASGYFFQRNPTALQWLKGEVVLPNAAFDLRTVSAAVVDLNAILDGQTLEKSLGFAPLAFSSQGRKPELSDAADVQRNSDYAFRAGFQSSVSTDSAASPCQLSGPFGSLPASSIVVATNTERADVVALSGWQAAASELRTRLGRGETQPILTQQLQPSPISLSAEIPTLKDIRTQVPALRIIDTGSACTFAWLRIDVFRSSLGREQSRFQIATSATSAEQVSRDADLTGMAAFTVSGRTILAGSFSGNQIQVLRVNGSTLENVGVFNP